MEGDVGTQVEVPPGQSAAPTRRSRQPEARRSRLAAGGARLPAPRAVMFCDAPLARWTMRAAGRVNKRVQQAL